MREAFPTVMRLRDIVEVRRAEQTDPETQHMLYFEICPGLTLASLHHPQYLRAFPWTSTEANASDE